MTGEINILEISRTIKKMALGHIKERMKRGIFIMKDIGLMIKRKGEGFTNMRMGIFTKETGSMI